MKKIILVWIFVCVVVIAGGVWYMMSRGQSDPSFLINGQPITLVNGRSETPVAPGSSSKVVTQYFGNASAGDISGDGIPDVAFILTQNSGGSGTFYYVVATILTENGEYIGTNAVLLGDRISPQTTEIRDGEIVVNYADRVPGEPMTEQPSVGVSKFFLLNETTLEEDTAAQKRNFIRVSSPRQGAEVMSPLVITGEARGNWYFEADFPIVLVDWDGKIIAQGVAKAEKDWMTTDFVPFTATLTFNTDDISGKYSNKGTLILKKDNPSGLPKNDDAIEIPVVLK